jgi:hypothetical protein
MKHRHQSGQSRSRESTLTHIIDANLSLNNFDFFQNSNLEIYS